MNDPALEWAKAIQCEQCSYPIGRTNTDPPASIPCGQQGIIRFRVIHPPRGQTTPFITRCERHIPPTLRDYMKAGRTTA